MPQAADPKRVIAVYLVLAFGLSSILWYIIAAKPQWAMDTGIIRYSVYLLMWCPAFAAIATRLALQRNLGGFGWKIGELRWWLLAMVIPIVVGLVMFSTAWISGAAPFLPDKAAAMLALPALQAILIAIVDNVFSATGEEIGWRGLLVPELGRVTTFTWIAILSAVIWFLWHLPLMIVGLYGDGSMYSIVVFFLSMIGGSTLFAWIRLRSGSIWPAALLHGFWNYFIQEFYPRMTASTEAGEAMLGEFGWYVVLISIVLGLLFWILRDRLPKMPKPEGGL
ncbi:MAG TPA: CPBP family intramembrane metalloprotease [Methanoregulaceae archaeon]|jgi:membrane protease YdiL (CAAX protease family)|nr:CPBP family intramembrane metalloprotease [Methanoregulaceae archaeon]